MCKGILLGRVDRDVGIWHEKKGREGCAEVWRKELKEVDNLLDTGVDGKYTNKMGLKESLWDRSDWINLDQDRDKWRVVVKTVIMQGRNQHILVNS